MIIVSISVRRLPRLKKASRPFARHGAPCLPDSAHSSPREHGPEGCRYRRGFPKYTRVFAASGQRGIEKNGPRNRLRNENRTTCSPKTQPISDEKARVISTCAYVFPTIVAGNIERL